LALFSSSFFQTVSHHLLTSPEARLIDAVPPTAKWLTEKEKAFVQARLPINAPRDSEKNFNFREIITSLKDVKMWLFTLCWATFTVGTSGLTFYQPTVVANLGFT
jgi:hypothetical protein